MKEKKKLWHKRVVISSSGIGSVIIAIKLGLSLLLIMNVYANLNTLNKFANLSIF